MASFLRKAMVYLGLQDDDEYGYDAYGDYPENGDYGEADATDPRGHPEPSPERRRQAFPEPRPPGYEGGGYPRQPREPRDPRDPRELHDAPRELRDSARDFGGEPTVRTIPRDDQPSGVGVTRPAVVRHVPTTAARVHIVDPRGFNDAQEVGDRLKANQPVILNLQGVSRELQRRLIDFSSGLAYGVSGSMSRVADQVFLLTPSNVEVSQEEKERLQARGLYRV
ncbi:MAG: cell division protein SepF [Actinobacteria bacterium]|nr:MAG: cell division protein SepF [Actinomycetota bacterium]